jgi:hypothetical protein
MDRKSTFFTVSALSVALLLTTVLTAEEKGVDWKAFGAAKVSLEKGLAAAQAQGKPISGKYEMEEGKLQLSVYTAKQNKFWEVIVDYATGKVSKTEEIKEGEDLSAAKAQSEAMGKAKKSLQAATEKALAANAGYRAVSVVPELKDGKPVAAIVLENATGTKDVSESLD